MESFDLRLLGSLDLRRENGESVAAVLAQPKRCALLAYLALSHDQAFRRRDVIASLLWPDQDQEHARGSLRQALRFLRRELGDDAIQNRGEEEIGLNTERVRCDVVEFERTITADAPHDAVRVYRGDLLEGVFVADAAPEFEQWVDAERHRLRALAGRALWRAVQDHRIQGAFGDAIVLARRAAALAPDDEAGVRRLLELLDETGDRAGALATYDQFVERLRTEYDAEPSAETQSMVAAIRARTLARPRVDGLPPLPAVSSRETAGEVVPRTPRRRLTIVAAVAFVAITLVYAFNSVAGHAAGAHPLVTVAVLPTRVAAGDTIDAALSEAVTDEQINDLARIGSLRVLNRRTMMQYAGSRAPLDSIAHQLNAGVIVMSTLAALGDSVALDVQLVMPGNPRAVWEQSFRGLRGDVLRWQQEVARRVSANVSVDLTPAERAGLNAARVSDAKTVDLYARGRWWWNKRGKANLFKAIGFFDQALDVTPTDALAWSGKADAFAQIGYGGFLPPEEAFRKAEASARHALELDPTLAEPHAALGFSLMYFDWNWPEAEREFRQAIELNPNYATAHEWYGLFLAAMARFPEAEAEGKIAEELDPLSAAVQATRGWITHYAGNEQEALRVLRRGFRTDSANGIVRLYLGRVHQAMGQFDSATAQYLATGTLASWVPTIAGEGTVAALTGRRAEALRVLARLDSIARGGEYVTPYANALVFAALGEKDSAFAHLDQGVRDRTHWMVWLARDSRWQPLRGDPRFDRLLHTVGLSR